MISLGRKFAPLSMISENENEDEMRGDTLPSTVNFFNHS